MKTFANIACAGVYHNQWTIHPRCDGHSVFAKAFCSILLACLPIGCASFHSHSQPAKISSWKLENAPTVNPQHLCRVRVSFDHPLPKTLTRKLSDEFTLVTIQHPDDWKSFIQRFHLQISPSKLNLEKGTIVGLLAQVGESANHQWPIEIDTVRCYSGYGRLKANFLPGIYHPLKTAAYLELIYVPDIKHIHTILINRRMFILPPLPAHAPLNSDPA